MYPSLALLRGGGVPGVTLPSFITDYAAAAALQSYCINTSSALWDKSAVLAKVLFRHLCILLGLLCIYLVLHPTAITGGRQPAFPTACFPAAHHQLDCLPKELNRPEAPGIPGECVLDAKGLHPTRLVTWRGDLSCWAMHEAECTLSRRRCASHPHSLSGVLDLRAILDDRAPTRAVKGCRSAHWSFCMPSMRGR